MSVCGAQRGMLMMELVVTMAIVAVAVLGLIQLQLRLQMMELEAGQLFRDIAGNTIILAILAGLLWRQTGLGLHPQLDQIVSMLAKAAIPSALVSLGLSLVGFRIAGQLPTLSMIVVLKLVLMPLGAWYLAAIVFQLPPLEVGVITVFAAMPTGANAYLFAEKHGRATNSASGAVALGTLLSVATAAATIYLLNQN